MGYSGEGLLAEKDLLAVARKVGVLLHKAEPKASFVEDVVRKRLGE